MSKSKSQILLPILGLGAVLWLGACDFFGAAGGLFIPEYKEVELGRSFDSTLRVNDTARQQYPIFETRNDSARIELQRYVVDLANQILAKVPASERPDYPFTFTIIDQNVENAFAVPGGYVYIYTGILKKMKDESELAGVLGHEISHVTWHHYRDALAKQAGMGLLVQALLGDDAGQLAQLVAGSLGALASLSVSRSNESEADHYGTIYCARADRNPMGIAKYFSRSTGAAVPEWVSSHPGSDNRVRDVTAQVNASAALKQVAADSARTNYTERFMAATRALR